MTSNTTDFATYCPDCGEQMISGYDHQCKRKGKKRPHTTVAGRGHAGRVVAKARASRRPGR